MGHFARECISPRNQESRPRNHDNGNRNQDSSRRTVNVEETSSKVMVAIDEAGFYWSFMAEEEVTTNMALMAFSDSEVYNDKTYSNTCLKSFETLKTQLDNLRVEFNKSEFNIATYKRGLASIEEQLVFYKKNEVIQQVNTAKAQAVNTARPKAVNTARPKAVNTARPKAVNTVRDNQANAVKASACWVWRPTKRCTRQIQGKPQQDDTGFIDSGCSRHMTGNITYLLDFKEFDRDYVTFGEGAHGGRIFGKGTLKTDSLDFKDATSDNHALAYRLGHINFKNINKLVKDNLVRAHKETNAGTSTQKIELVKDCIVMPIWKDLHILIHLPRMLSNGEPKSAADDQKQVEDGPDNENDEKDKSEDDSSPKEVNTAGQHVNTASPEVNTGTQDKYVAEILKKFNYIDVKSASTPIDLEKHLVKDGDADDSLIFQVTPKTSHLLAIKRIFRYMEMQTNIRLSPCLREANLLSIWHQAKMEAMLIIKNVGDEAVHKELGDRIERAPQPRLAYKQEQGLYGPQELLEQIFFAIIGYRKKKWGMNENEGFRALFILKWNLEPRDLSTQVKDPTIQLEACFRDELDNVVEEEDGEWICFLGGNNSSGTKKYRGSNSSDGGNTRDGVKITGGVIGSGGGIESSEELKEVLPDEADEAEV
ncbi:hypothetical protein Tco_0393008 [Tanacetum coccineum]